MFVYLYWTYAIVQAVVATRLFAGEKDTEGEGIRTLGEAVTSVFLMTIFAPVMSAFLIVVVIVSGINFLVFGGKGEKKKSRKDVPGRYK